MQLTQPSYCEVTVAIWCYGVHISFKDIRRAQAMRVTGWPPHYAVNSATVKYVTVAINLVLWAYSTSG